MEAGEAKTTRLLLEAARLLAGSEDPMSGLDRIGEIMLGAISQNRTVFYSFDEARDELTVLSTGGGPVPPVGSVFGLGELTPGARRVLEQRCPEVIEVELLPEAERGIAEEFGVRKLLAVPLLSRSRVLGVVVVDDSDAPEKGFSDSEIEVVEAFAALIATVLHSASLLEAEEQARKALADELAMTRLLLDLARVVSADGRLEEILEAIAMVLLEATDHSRVSVVLFDKTRRALTMVVSKGEAPVPAGTELLLENASAALKLAIDSKQRVVADYDETPDGGTSVVRNHESHLSLIAPIVHRGRVLGAVSVDDPGERREFTDRDIEIVDALVSQAATAVEGARLREIERESARLGDALAEIDALIHSSLNFEEIAQRALKAAASALGADTGAIIGKEADGWLTWNSLNFEPSVVGVRLTDAENPHGVAALVSERTIAIDDAFVDPRVDNEFMKSYDLRSVIVSPLMIRGEGVACLYYNYNGAIHRFSEPEIRFIARVASSLSLALDHARLFEALRESGDRVNAILRSIGDAFFAVDREWRFTYVNPAAERVVRHEAEALIGRSLWSIFPQAAGTPLQQAFQLTMDTGEPSSLVATYPPLELCAEVRVYASAEGISVYLTDISERMAAETALAQARERADMLAMLLDDSSQPFMVGAPGGRFVMFNRAFEELTGYSAAELERMKWPDDVTSPATLSAETVAIAAIDRTGEPQRFEKEFLRKDGTLVPAEVLRHGHSGPDGAIEFYYGFMTDISERKAAQEALETERQRLRQIIDDVPLGITLFDAAGATVEVNEANRTIWAGDLPGTVSAFTFGQGRVFDPESGASIPAEEMPAACVVRTGLAAERTAEIVRFDGTRATVRFSATPVTKRSGELSRAVLISEDVTSQIESRRLDDALNSIGTAVTTTLDSEEILRRLVHLSAEALGAETAGLTLTRRHGWTVREAFGMAVGSRSALEDPTLESVLLDWSEHAPIVINDVTKDARVDASTMAELGIRSLMLVPISSQNAIVGALVFHHRTERVGFSAEQVDFATSLMGITSLAFENARLFERERGIADTLQKAALAPPGATPGVVHAVAYRPASSAANIGGDFYNVFSINPTHVGILIGDVSGKGLDAARLTSLLQDSVRAYSFEDFEPSRVVTRVNRLVHHLSALHAFATMWFGVLEPETGRLAFTAGGHPSPIVVSVEGARFLDGERCPIVGAFEEARYTESEVTIGSDEMLVLYTDGITEARDAEGVMFGDESLLETVQRLRHTSVRRMPDRIVGSVMRFAQGTLRDDTIVLCVSRTSAAGA